MKLQYLDKRDNRGVILRYSAHELAFNVSFQALDLIKKNSIYSVLVRSIPQKYIDLYYQKMIYEAFLPVAHQLAIYRHDKEKNETKIDSVIHANGFPCSAVLAEVWQADWPNFSISFFSQIRRNVKDKLKQFRNESKKINPMLLYITNRDNKNGILNSRAILSSKIAVNYQEGFNTNKRSDIFWFENSDIDPNAILVYYETPQMMTRFDEKESAQNYFMDKGFHQLKIWKWHPRIGCKYYEQEKSALKAFSISNSIDKWMYRTARNLFDRVSYWSNFFYNHNIKIHLDPTESGLEPIAKQIALYEQGGISIGKTRSYPPNLNGAFLGYYPNDIFFGWGKDSARRIEKNNPHLQNIIISGHPYSSNKDDQNHTKDFEGKSRNTKYNVLLLDTNHGLNKELHQFIPTTEMTKFYTNILSWVKEDEEINLTIKPKKPHFLDSLVEVKDQIFELEKNTCRINLVKNSFQKMPHSYLNGSDIVIGLSTFFPSGLIECVVHGARAVFYDWPNLYRHETDFYRWGRNKVVFPNLEEMIMAVKAYKNDPSSNPKLGDWSKHLDALDPFRDNRGGERIGSYIRFLQEGFQEGFNRGETIDHANNNYAEAWGKDKIYS